MRAVYLVSHGAPDSVVVGERDRPALKSGEVLVRLHAAAINHVDLYMRDSGAGISHTLPQIMGVDGAGTIEDSAAPEAPLKPGDPVVLYPAVFCGLCPACLAGDTVLCARIRFLGEHRDGTFAAYIAVPAVNAVPIPPGLDMHEAAALPVAHLTAWRMLVTMAKIAARDTVLIWGIGGGVALAALGIAKLAGARVFVTSGSADKLARAAELGADAAIDHAGEDVVQRVMALTDRRGVDIVVDSVGERTWPASLRALAKGGRLVTCGATTGGHPSADLQRLFVRQIAVFGSTLGNLAEFRDLVAVAGRGQLRPVIDSRLPLEEAGAGLQRLAATQQFGKIVLEIG